MKYSSIVPRKKDIINGTALSYDSIDVYKTIITETNDKKKKKYTSSYLTKNRNFPTVYSESE